MRFELKRLHKDAIGRAIQRAEHYRLLNEPRQAESICLDILACEPGNQRALVLLLLARTDQFVKGAGARVDDAREVLRELTGEYERAYYAGIICERWGKALLSRDDPGSGAAVFEWLHQAMGWYEKAEALSGEGHDDPILRWNACARLLMRHAHVRPRGDEEFHPLLE
jgi:hypothetical protein